ncbi:TonB-dependent receptor plug domain-containing protein [Sphingopyxis sp. PET50]|uniref:TonB-dependent receptor plug domain-containing protein n=1 Tax=Sphingopyxis sp. PET50 TaxID=2976533 RepID=UPI0021AFD14C|nr:TonB-dependent receptor plug domain-containing protein [Sphingopyxis sp. PET50]
MQKVQARPTRRVGELKRFNICRLGGAVASIALSPVLLIATPAYAQTDPDDAAASAHTASDQEIIVTARRRDEAEQDVPMSITVVGQKDLNERGVRTIADLPSVAPGLTTSYQAGRRGELIFSQRGQGQAFGGSAPGVATYFADVPDFGTAIYDLSNVAVLKGPQGTLFGRNTTGGAVLLTPAAPEDEWGGYLVGRLGDYKRRDVEFAVTGLEPPKASRSASAANICRAMAMRSTSLTGATW